MDDEQEPQARCERCKYVWGLPQKHNVSLLRCDACDFPFGETYEAVRSLALSLQDPKNGIHYNVRSQVVCYSWLVLYRDGLDLNVEKCLDVEEFGREPEWLWHETSDNGWEGIINPAYDRDHGRWNMWALQQGLCPGQPFLVELEKPHYYRCSWEYDEWDVSYAFDIVMRDPRSPKQAARAWAGWWKKCAAYKVAHERARAREQHKREHDTKAMYLQRDMFWADSYGDGYPPNGYIVALCSKHTYGGWLIQGRSPDKTWPRAECDQEPSWEKALDDLIKNVKKHFPHLDPEFVRKLPVGRY